MKNHIKRIAAPKGWNIDRKSRIYIVKPKAGAHSLEMGIALGILLRDELKITSTLSETRKLLSSNEVLVDGIRRKEYRYIVGLFDVVTLPLTKQSYRLILDTKGRITLISIPAGENGIKLCKITGKKIIAGGKTQINLHDGKNILSDVKVKVGDSVLLSFPKTEIKEVFSLKAGSPIAIFKGKFAGSMGKFKEVKDNEVIYTEGDSEKRTLKDYLFVLGKDKPAITLKPQPN